MLSVDGTPVPFRPGDSVLLALLRAGLHPTGGGCLCLAGDCGHCLVSVDGVGYIRSCQTPAKKGQVVTTDHSAGAHPPLIRDQSEPAARTPARHLHCEVAVLGLGEAGRAALEAEEAAGHRVIGLDANNGQEIVGIYAGPKVVARTDDEVLVVHVDQSVIVATGAAEIQPVAPGTEHAGLLTTRAAEQLAAAGVELGRVVALGKPPRGVEAETYAGRLVEVLPRTPEAATSTASPWGANGLGAASIEAPDGTTTMVACDTLVVGLGLHPRDALFRMGNGLAIRAVGDAAIQSEIPPCPRQGIVCTCIGVSVADLGSVWERGFRELELVKRATLAGTGTCQGAACLPYIRSYLEERGQELQPPFTARPVTRQLTLGEIAAGSWLAPTQRTPLHEEHLRLGARMERTGGWWRPYDYGDTAAEMRAVREAVSVGDVSTLGKLQVAGPDAEAFLEKVYPTKISTLEVGRSRYVLLLDERGYVIDDGMISRDGNNRFMLSLTTGGSNHGEAWLRDWAESGPFDVHILNQTQSLGAINVTGPRTAELLARAGVAELPRFLGQLDLEVCGIACRVYRLSFSGEVSFELHHAVSDSVALWRQLLALGADLGVRAHGFDALLRLRLEKGHLIVGRDTDFDSTPRRLAHEWAVSLAKEDFVGRQAILRTNEIPLDRQLTGFEMESPAPIEGAVIRSTDGEHLGHVTSSTDSLVLGHAVMLGWLELRDGRLPDSVVIDGRDARRVDPPFYDPKGRRARAPIDLDQTASAARQAGARPPVLNDVERTAPTPFEPLLGWRVVAKPEALERLAALLAARETSRDRAQGPLVLRCARDELLFLEPQSPADSWQVDLAVAVEDLSSADPHHLMIRETGIDGLWLDPAHAEEVIARCAEWRPPQGRPAFAQGALAGIPVKIWFEERRVLLLVAHAFAAALSERIEVER